MKRSTWQRDVMILAVGCLSLMAASCEFDRDLLHEMEATSHEVEVVIEPRIPQLETFSCQEQCHFKLVPNPEQRDLTEFHTFRPVKHGPAIEWCSFCHRIEDIDHLRLLDNSPITFDESHRLCGQCHGDKYRDWEAGIHGVQTGGWRGVQQRRSCPFCHDPHVPGIPHVKALPAPWRPSKRWESESEE
jgi:hypothetical protein